MFVKGIVCDGLNKVTATTTTLCLYKREKWDVINQ